MTHEFFEYESDLKELFKSWVIEYKDCEFNKQESLDGLLILIEEYK